MNTMRSLRLPLVLAVLAVIGIIGMLILDGAGDAAAFVLASLPLIVGAGALVRHRFGRLR
jgi:cytochrome c-type biogenesis protein CcmE